MDTVPADVALNQTYAHALARVLVRPLLGTWVRPNHLTSMRLVIGVAACLLLTVDNRNAAVWSGILWIVTCVLDRADGELARMGDLRSESGKILDFYSDMILDAFWFLGAGIGLRHGWLGAAAVPLGALTCASMLVCMGGAELFERLSGPGIKTFYGVRHFHPDDALFLLPLFVWAGWLAPLLIAASICTPIIAIITVGRYLLLKRQRGRPRA
jgi:archaetidylinositol phosphate synthase